MWIDNFVDVLAVVFTSLWFWGFITAVLITALVIAYVRTDENDRKLEEMERAASERLRQRLAEDGDEESILKGVYNESAPKDRMVRLTTPHESQEPHFLVELLEHYQLSLEIEGDADRMTLVDRKFFELKNKRVTVDRWDLIAANKDEARKILSAARSTINRRAERAGLRTTNSSRGRYARKAAA